MQTSNTPQLREKIQKQLFPKYNERVILVMPARKIDKNLMQGATRTMKRGKSRRLICVTVDNNGRFSLHKLKPDATNQQVFHPTTVKVGNLRAIDGGSRDQEDFFALVFEDKGQQKWAADNSVDKMELIWLLLAICRIKYGFMPKTQKIDLAELSFASDTYNFQGQYEGVLMQPKTPDGGPHGLETITPRGELIPMTPGTPAGDGGLALSLLSESEEKEMDDLMTRLKLGESNAHEFQDKLEDNMRALERANVHTTLQSADTMGRIVKQLKDLPGTLNDLSSQLDQFTGKFQQLQKDLQRIQVKNDKLETRQKNYVLLLKELNGLVTGEFISKEDVTNLQQADLSTVDGRDAALASVEALQKSIGRFEEMDSEMRQMGVVKSRYEELCRHGPNFAMRVIAFTKNTIFQPGDIEDESMGDPVLPRQDDMMAKAKPFKDVLIAIKEVDVKRFDTLVETYVLSIRLKFKQARIRFIQMMRECISDNFSMVSTFDMTDEKGLENSGAAFAALKMARMMNSQLQPTDAASARSGREGRAAATRSARLDPAQIQMALGQQSSGFSDKKIDKAYLYIMREVISSILGVREFCMTIFNMEDEDSDDGGQRVTMHAILNKLFGQFQGEFEKLIDASVKIDPFFTLGMLADTEQLMNDHKGQGKYVMSLLLSNRQNLTKNFTAFVDEQIQRINEQKVPTQRCGVLICFQKFPELAARMELALTGKKLRSVADHTYHRFVSAMFSYLKRIKDNFVKHGCLINLQNYHHFHYNLAELDEAKLAEYVKDAEEGYEVHVKTYVLQLLKRFFGQSFDFFEGVDRALETIPSNEIQFHHSYSKANLRRLLKSELASVERNLGICFKKMQKHLDDEMNLLPEVWPILEKHFIDTYSHWEDIVIRSYPDERMVMTTHELEELFSS